MKIIISFLVTALAVFSTATPTNALQVVDPPPTPTSANSPVIITAYQLSANDVVFVQLFNNSDQVVSLNDLQLQVADQLSSTVLPIKVVSLEAWLLPKNYMVVANSSVTGADTTFALSAQDMQMFSAITKRSIQLASSSTHTVYDQVLADTYQWKYRKPTISGNYTATTTTFELATATQLLYGSGLYMPPLTQSGLKILEVLANPRICTPTEKLLDCGDYIKLYNPTDKPIDLSLYRLRSDSGGTKSSATNTFALSGILAPRGYSTVYQRASSEAIALTNTGGQIWLQDAYGAVDYDEYVAYPDASADNKKGQSWAYDTEDNTWKWMNPQPLAANYWPPVQEAVAPTVALASTDCGPGRERNPETNRCRNAISVGSVSRVPCKAGQERNTETNRCRSVLAATTSLAVCKTGETRNPGTNRCRKNTTTASSVLPCKPGYERNIETNRCRKSQNAVNTASITDVKTNQITNTKAWWLAGAILIAALTYALYEWRQDLWLKFKRSKS